jgi:hypothetical protein
LAEGHSRLGQTLQQSPLLLLLPSLSQAVWELQALLLALLRAAVQAGVTCLLLLQQQWQQQDHQSPAMRSL